MADSKESASSSENQDAVLLQTMSGSSYIVEIPQPTNSGAQEPSAVDQCVDVNLNDKQSSVSSGHSQDHKKNAEEEKHSSVVDVPRIEISNSENTSQGEGQFPDTVTVLTTENGTKVYLVGTAHFSLESQEDVSKTIKLVQPNAIVVELCKGRVNILQLDEKTILEEAKNLNFDKIKATIVQNGFIRGMMYILLLSMSAHLTKQLGMAPGGEFRRAFAEAKQVPGCIVHLGDRPIHITLQRALASLSWWQKLRLTWQLMMNKEPISKEDVEQCKQRDLLEEMLAEMTGEFPALSQVFVKERDIYLTYSLQVMASAMSCQHLRQATKTPAIVGVVGMGHVPGIVQHWGKITEADIPPIMRIPPPSKTSRFIKFTLKTSVVVLVLWGCVKILPLPQRIRPSGFSLKSLQTYFAPSQV